MFYNELSTHPRSFELSKYFHGGPRAFAERGFRFRCSFSPHRLPEVRWHKTRSLFQLLFVHVSTYEIWGECNDFHLFRTFWSPFLQLRCVRYFNAVFMTMGQQIMGLSRGGGGGGRGERGERGLDLNVQWRLSGAFVNMSTAPEILAFPASDIDECAAGSHSCSQNARCSNTIGSFTCTCHSRYYGDGVNCTSESEALKHNFLFFIYLFLRFTFSFSLSLSLTMFSASLWLTAQCREILQGHKKPNFHNERRRVLDWAELHCQPTVQSVLRHDDRRR